MTDNCRRQISLWLLCGVVMIYFQIILGGITRLTGSGLSITKWDIITGTIPPLNTESWNEAFGHYKATPQYHKLNKGMSLGEFKFIYFWEYVHRLWARTMGFVFAIPFAVFLYQKKLSSSLIKKLLVLVLLAAVVASFGWIMVKSGLVNRPWVDAYKLTMHLTLALVTFGYCWWLWMSVFYRLTPAPSPKERGVQALFLLKNAELPCATIPALKKFASALLIILSFQIILGGLMSGMKAGLLYPTFPDMNGKIIPDVLLSASNWNLHSLLHYDTSTFAPTLVQFVHRCTAYVLLILVFVFFLRSKKAEIRNPLSSGINILIMITVLQVILGILTVVNFRGEVPVLLGVLHQAVAILLLTAMLFVFFHLRKPESLP